MYPCFFSCHFLLSNKLTIFSPTESFTVFIISSLSDKLISSLGTIMTLSAETLEDILVLLSFLDLLFLLIIFLLLIKSLLLPSKELLILLL